MRFGTGPLGTAVARQAPAGQAGVATGGSLAFTYLGVVCGSPAFGALAAASGSYRIAFTALSVPALLARRESRAGG